MKIVLDASAAIPATLGIGAGSELLARVRAASVVLAPELFVAEVANGLWKYVIAGELAIESAPGALREALSLVAQFEGTAVLAVDALREAAARRHSVYDMFYVVLARREQATLLTLDNRMRELAQAMNIATA
ncbi:MAG TPA: type II toxin-antitoxin system VapC family toxin [Thermoanaerobaculia bacterium]|nr:type II toxin-antitoxin system VapC family toxin [Thermoanaerobaculia bacterium]